MAFEIGKKVWTKPAGRRRYHHATIVNEIYNGKAFFLRWRKHSWDDSVVCSRTMRPFVTLMGLTRTVCGVRYHDTDMAGGVPH
eukprot:3845191-Ditylum_brightwellii.AAC.1